MTSLLITLKIIPMIFAALFPVVNPIGTALVLYGMTSAEALPDNKEIKQLITELEGGKVK